MWHSVVFTTDRSHNRHILRWCARKDFKNLMMQSFITLDMMFWANRSSGQQRVENAITDLNLMHFSFDFSPFAPFSAFDPASSFRNRRANISDIEHRNSFVLKCAITKICIENGQWLLLQCNQKDFVVTLPAIAFCLKWQITIHRNSYQTIVLDANCQSKFTQNEPTYTHPYTCNILRALDDVQDSSGTHLPSSERPEFRFTKVTHVALPFHSKFNFIVRQKLVIKIVINFLSARMALNAVEH